MMTPTKIEYGETEAFQKDLKRLLKKFRTLEEDLETAQRNAIDLYHLKGIDNRSTFPISDFCSEEIKIFKIRKFACKALKGRGVMSGIRVIYAFYPATFKVDFIEIYFKGEKENEDVKRIKAYLKNHIEALPSTPKSGDGKQAGEKERGSGEVNFASFACRQVVAADGGSGGQMSFDSLAPHQGL